jgi:hypothetical protein
MSAPSARDLLARRLGEKGGAGEAARFRCLVDLLEQAAIHRDVNANRPAGVGKKWHQHGRGAGTERGGWGRVP